MKTVRLETTEFGQTSFVKEGVNKLFEFGNNTGTLRVYVLKESRLVSFSCHFCLSDFDGNSQSRLLSG